MAYENIIVEKKEEGIVKITLNRPHVLNALNNATSRELTAAWQEVQRDETIDVVILTGAGRAFCAGRDLKETGDTDDFFTTDEAVRDALRLPQRIGATVIAALNGVAVTAGFELVLACDIVIASETASLRDTHASFNFIPGAGLTQILPRLVGDKKAKEIMLASDFISAKEAERIGLVNKVVPPEKLEEEVMALARKITAQPKPITRKLKQVINDGMKLDFNAAMMLEQMEHRTWREKMAGRQVAERAPEVMKGARAEIRREQS